MSITREDIFLLFVVAIFVVVAVANQILKCDEKLENFKNSLIFCGHRLLRMVYF